MIVSNKDLNDDMLNSLKELLDKDISPKSAFDLLKITSVLEDLVNNKNKVHSKILEKYAEVDPTDSNKMIIKKDLVDKYKNDVNELMSIKHEIGIDKLKVDDLNLSENIKTKIIGSLKFLFEIELPTVTPLEQSNN